MFATARPGITTLPQSSDMQNLRLTAVPVLSLALVAFAEMPEACAETASPISAHDGAAFFDSKVLPVLQQRCTDVYGDVVKKILA